MKKKIFLECLKPLGMESREIEDSAIKTGKGAVSGGKEGYYARLHNDKAWCIPKITGHSGPGEFRSNIYVEVTFPGHLQVSAMALQGKGSYSYGEYIRISYEYNGEFYFHKFGGTEQVRIFFLSPNLSNNGKSLKKTKESAYIMTRHLAVLLEAIAVLEFNRFPMYISGKNVTYLNQRKELNKLQKLL